MPLRLCVCDGDCVPVCVRVGLALDVGVMLAVCEGDRVCVCVDETVELWDWLGVEDSDAVWLDVCDCDADIEADCDAVGTWLGDCVSE